MMGSMMAELENEAIKEEHEEMHLREVAVHIANGMPRNDAFQKVREDIYLREEARVNGMNVICDDEGFVEEYLESEINPPSEANSNKKQIYAIYSELKDSGELVT